jgi:stearoyl-CoA desaturase (Delta-9 desaturase)
MKKFMAQNITLSSTDGSDAAPSRFEQAIAALTVSTPPVLTVVALVYHLSTPITAADIALCCTMYVITMVGITMGFHRHYTHRSFKTGRVVKYVLGVAGSMAAQGPLVFWVACHRRHHKFSDQPQDPHSPHRQLAGKISDVGGLLHAHVGWMLKHRAGNYFRLAPDILRDEASYRISRLYLTWVLLGLLIPMLLGGLLSFTWKGAFSGLLLGGFVRLFLTQHATWSINSICHWLGARPYETGDRSANNLICALLTLGEGWHNNHHAFPASARHGLRRWEIDITYLLILLSARLGLAWDIQTRDTKKVRSFRSSSPPAVTVHADNAAQEAGG